MRTRKIRRSSGFTLIELMIVVGIIGILSAIAIPRFKRYEGRARQGEATTNLKAIFTAARTQHEKPTGSMLGLGVSPDRGNRYAYMLEQGCPNGIFDRSSIDEIVGLTASCIGPDTFSHDHIRHPAETEAKMGVVGVEEWSVKGRESGLGDAAGIFGTQGHWDFLVYAAGDVDNSTSDLLADTWIVSSADGRLRAVCPVDTVGRSVSAGEPFMVVDDSICD